MTLPSSPGPRLRQALQQAHDAGSVLPFVGIYDLFSASLAARRFDALFLSGFGLAASSFGLPDVGFISWGDLVASTGRLRALLPDHHLLVDIDDGFGDAPVAAHVARSLERCGASGVVLEDQARPRRCGHLEGKRLVPLADHLAKLDTVLRERRSLVVVARTDASDPAEILERIQAFDRLGCDAVLADGLQDLDLIRRLREAVRCPLFCNVIGGGRVPPCSRAALAGHGVQGLIYSTPCLFAAQGAIEQALGQLGDDHAPLPAALAASHQLSQCDALLQANLRSAGGA
ncbi:MAG: isocitrate lyase/PEP mutase family protein [Synechococcaceae cyanobacterium]|nr:isocitrate lyase/PEP mutase family protein [Synechococcaceae cyanobacterium]